MDPETLDRACRNGFTTKRDGNGLGLFITKRLCRLINAKLRLESIAGEGTTAALILADHQAVEAEEQSGKKDVMAMQCERERG
jgi:signal transduction histidine kinase